MEIIFLSAWSFFHFFFFFNENILNNACFIEMTGGLTEISLRRDVFFICHVHWDNRKMETTCQDEIDISDTITVYSRTDLPFCSSSDERDRRESVHHNHCCLHHYSNSMNRSNACWYDGSMMLRFDGLPLASSNEKIAQDDQRGETNNLLMAMARMKKTDSTGFMLVLTSSNVECDV